MKRIKTTLLLLFIAVFTGLTFVSCSEEEEDNVSTWVCKVSDNVSITMKLYKKERKFYTEVKNDNFTKELCFFNDTWAVYEQVSRDTIKIMKMWGEYFSTIYPNDMYWTVVPANSSHNTLIWQCESDLPLMPINTITRYKFERKL